MVALYDSELGNIVWLEMLYMGIKSPQIILVLHLTMTLQPAKDFLISCKDHSQL